MISSSRFKLIGKVKEPHGLKGDLYILVFSKDVSWAPQLTQFQIHSPTGEVMECDVISQKPFRDGLLVKVKQIQDRNSSEKVKGHQVLIPEELLVSPEGEDIYLHEILGFDVFLKDQCVGMVEGFSSNGPQDILIIRNEEHIFEVPFVKDFIEDIQFENKKIIMDFPEGLMNLNES